VSRPDASAEPQAPSVYLLTTPPVFAQGLFDGLFGTFSSRPPPEQGFQQRRTVRRPQHQQSSDSARPPAPKLDSKGTEGTTSILVIGDDMAEWLAYGLEEAFSDTPQVRIVRRITPEAGLVRYSAKTQAAWPQIVREIFSQEKADYVVIMLGLSDRQDMRDRGSNEEGKPPDPKGTEKNLHFKGEEWAKAYAKRVDEAISALKIKGVPVFWVGLPPIRGTRSTTDVAYLNELYRAEAERAGATYVDVWEGFVDDSGRYSPEGPDVEGQARRLRSSDGVFFTKYGARKLAHFMERELQRYMSGSRSPTVLAPAINNLGKAPEKPTERPLAGPVLPMMVAPAETSELLGRSGDNGKKSDALADKVLLKGEAITAPVGRADNFSWPRGTAETNLGRDRSIVAEKLKSLQQNGKN